MDSDIQRGLWGFGIVAGAITYVVVAAKLLYLVTNKGVDRVGHSDKMPETAQQGDWIGQGRVHLLPVMPTRPALGLSYYVIELTKPNIHQTLYAGDHARWESDRARAIHFEFYSIAQAWAVCQLGLGPKEFRVELVMRIPSDI